MPKIPQFFSSAKLTPSDLGFQGFETAARRIGSSAEQTAAGTKALGNDVARLWDSTGRIIGEQYQRGGGGGGVGHGSTSVSRTLIGTGSNSGVTHNIVNPPGTGLPGEFDARAHREISNAAPALVNAATQATTAISPAPDAAGQTTIIRGGKPQTTSASDVTGAGETTVLRPGQPPQVVQSYPGAMRGLSVDDPMNPKTPKNMPGLADPGIEPTTGKQVSPGAIGVQPLPGSVPAPDRAVQPHVGDFFPANPATGNNHETTASDKAAGAFKLPYRPVDNSALANNTYGPGLTTNPQAQDSVGTGIWNSIKNAAASYTDDVTPAATDQVTSVAPSQPATITTPNISEYTTGDPNAAPADNNPLN